MTFPFHNTSHQHSGINVNINQPRIKYLRIFRPHKNSENRKPPPFANNQSNNVNRRENRDQGMFRQKPLLAITGTRYHSAHTRHTACYGSTASPFSVRNFKGILLNIIFIPLLIHDAIILISDKQILFKFKKYEGYYRKRRINNHKITIASTVPLPTNYRKRETGPG